MKRSVDPDDVVTVLEQRLARYPAERYPVQHATAQFHLGVALTEAGKLAEAEEALATAARLFEPNLPVDHAKATNALGAVSRAAGRVEEATERFRLAAEDFARADLPLEEGIATHNLGLACKDAGDGEAALTALEKARRLFEKARSPEHAAAAAREQGTLLLELGRAEEAVDVLKPAVSLSERTHNRVALATTANALGLALLALNRPQEALAAFRGALGATPATVRPELFAMVKANLAVAYEAAGDRPRARTSARQAIAVSEAPAPVLRQSREVIRRLGNPAGDLWLVLKSEAQDLWPGIVRDELTRWAREPPETRKAEAAAWIELYSAGSNVAGSQEREAMTEALLAGLLEITPREMDAVIRSAVEAARDCRGDLTAPWQSGVERAFVRFPIPQWERLRAAFNRAAAVLGRGQTWG
ncbi:MAG TPA: tetratricopeptide repeat protein [Actinomycetota bacterium]|nr:tetratricopeptide repeat protein [Actinomycetota bacterium]